MFSKMFKSTFKSYLGSIKYVFAIIGILVVVLAIAVSVSWKGYYDCIVKTSDQLTTLFVDKYHLSRALVNEFIDAAPKVVNFGDPLKAAKELIDPQVLAKILAKCPSLGGLSPEVIVNDIVPIAKNFADEFMHDTNILLLSAGIGLLVGFFVVQWLLEKNIKGSKLKHFIVVLIIRWTLAAVFILLQEYLAFKLNPIWSSIIIELLYIPLIFMSFWEARLFYSKKDIATKEIFSAGSFLGVLLSMTIVYVGSAAITFCLYNFVNPVIGVVIGAPLMMIALSVSNNAPRFGIGEVVYERKALARA